MLAVGDGTAPVSFFVMWLKYGVSRFLDERLSGHKGPWTFVQKMTADIAS